MKTAFFLGGPLNGHTITCRTWPALLRVAPDGAITPVDQIDEQPGDFYEFTGSGSLPYEAATEVGFYEPAEAPVALSSDHPDPGGNAR